MLAHSGLCRIARFHSGGTAPDFNRLPDQVKDENKETRSRTMIKLRDELSRDFRKRYIGKTRPVLFEEEIKAGKEVLMVGFTPEYIRVAASPKDVTKNGIYDIFIEDFIDDELMRGTVK